MVRHNANAQRLGDISLKSSLNAHRVRLIKLGGNFSSRVSWFFQSWVFHIDCQQRNCPSRAPIQGERTRESACSQINQQQISVNKLLA